MSKPVRIKDFVASQVEEIAVVERRSFANTVEALLLDALDRRNGGLAERGGSPSIGTRGLGAPDRGLVDGVREKPRSASAVPPAVQSVGMETARGLALRDGRCSADVARGTKCKLCGKVH